MRADAKMTRNVFVVPAELSLSAAWQIMQRKMIRHLPVVRGRRLIGILSDRDILLRASPRADGVTVPADLVGTAMSVAVIRCRVDTPVSELARLMVEHKIDSIPVVADDDWLVGLVTSTDLMQLLIDEPAALRPYPLDFHLYEGEAMDVMA